MAKNIIIALLSLVLLFLLFTRSCNSRQSVEKGFSVERSADESDTKRDAADTLGFATRPSGVLFTQETKFRLVPIYKLNYNRRKKGYYTGSTRFHSNYNMPNTKDINNWNGNYMPGFEAAYGYNMVNLSQFDTETKTERPFFDEPVLINTIYYPTLTSDTLNGQTIARDYYMISVYDEATNGDGFINRKALRRFYHFNRTTGEKTALIPTNSSVMSSEYDFANDYMYIYARQDENTNGTRDEAEPINLWWIDLKAPDNRGLVYDN